MTNAMYQVRIPESLRAKFANLVPWGYQGHVVKALFLLLLDRAAIDGEALTIAKLVDGRYKLIEVKQVEPPELKIDET